MDTKLLTYGELAAHLGIAVDSAKRLARRRRWQKQPGNDGLARVAVPVERLVRPDVPADDPADVPGDIRGDIPADIPEDDRGDVRAVISALEDHVATLKAALAKAETEAKRDRARADGLNQDLDVAWRELALARVEAATVPALKETIEALKAALASSRDQTVEIRAERD